MKVPIYINGEPTPLLGHRGPRPVYVECIMGCGETKVKQHPSCEIPGYGSMCHACKGAVCSTCHHKAVGHPWRDGIDLCPRFGGHMGPVWQPCRYCDCNQFTKPRDAEEALLIYKHRGEAPQGAPA